jgi:hypothetical protein
MANCIYCGRVVSPAARYCPQCGQPDPAPYIPIPSQPSPKPELGPGCFVLFIPIWGIFLFWAAPEIANRLYTTAPYEEWMNKPLLNILYTLILCREVGSPMPLLVALIIGVLMFFVPLGLIAWIGVKREGRAE